MQRLGESILYAYARYFPVRRGKMRLVNKFWRHAVSSDNTTRIARLNAGGFLIRCDLSQYLQRQFYFFGTYLVEEDLLDCWSGLARSAATVFDVGANAGIFSLAALAARPSAVVHAFEPTPEIVERLHDTVRRNRLAHLHVHELAVGAMEGEAYLNYCQGETGANDGMNYVSDAVGSGAAVPVEITTLDAFCARRSISRIDLLKLDIQGYEANALFGAERLLIEGRIGIIVTELNWCPNGESPCPASKSIQLLTRHGFMFAKPATPLDFHSAGDWLRSLTEVIATRV